ncbi:MAG: hypothetical protein KF716_17190 [Anaerolineae bacterium]|nr:hypothetical protein [Anaerolineae bacterium]
MKTALRLSLLLVFLATCLIVLMIAIGRAIGGGDPLQMVGFEVCAGKPCYRGLIPGETDWNFVQPALDAGHVKYVQSDSTFTTKLDIVTEHWLIEIISSPQRQRVSQILWMYRDDPLTIGHFILMYGLPCFKWHNNSDLLIATFRNLNINARTNVKSHFSLQSPVYGLSLTDFLPAGCERLLNS